MSVSDRHVLSSPRMPPAYGGCTIIWSGSSRCPVWPSHRLKTQRKGQCQYQPLRRLPDETEVRMRRSAGKMLGAIMAFVLSYSFASSEEALSPAAQRGLVFVRTHCAKCHSIDRVSKSPLPM